MDDHFYYLFDEKKFAPQLFGGKKLKLSKKMDNGNIMYNNCSS